MLHAMAVSLVEVGCTPCQEAMRQAIIARSGDPHVQFNLIADFAQLGHADAATIAFWQQLAGDANQTARTRGMADLALGAVVRQSGTEGPDLTASYRAQLAGDQPLDTPAAVHLLGVLGNGGSPRDLQTVLSYAESGDLALRREALESLRFQSAPQAQVALVNHLATDLSPDARRSACMGLMYQTPTATTVKVVADTVHSDQDSAVRLEALETLWTWRAADPSIVDMVRGVAKSHPSEKTRAAASRLLSTIGGVTP